MAKNYKKLPKQGSSSSVDEEDMATSNCESPWSSMDTLNKVVKEGFANIHTDIDNMCNLRLELKTEIDGIKSTIKDIEKSLESTQEDVEGVKEDVKKVTEDLSKSTNTLNEKIVTLEQFSKSPDWNAKIAKLETQLKQQIEDNIRLEQYMGRENLPFNNILEAEDEDCKSVIQNIIQQMEIDYSTIRYHAVHRVGKDWKEDTGRLF